MHKTLGLRDPTAAFPLPSVRDDDMDRRAANQAVATQQFTTTIDPPLQITPTLPAGTVGKPYGQDLTAQGGAPPYSWSIFANDPLPPGLSLGTTPPDYNNVLTGTPTQAGTFSFLIQVTDAQGHSVNATMTITINQ